MEVVEFRGRVMASDLHIIALDPVPGQIDDEVAHLEHLERVWSRFIPTSDISRINTMAGATIAVDDATLTLIATMLEAWRVTGGRYDPSVLPALLANGYVASRTDPTQQCVLPDGVARVGAVDDIHLDPDTCMVTVPPGVALDPGGIGKGLAADLAVARLLAHGARGALVGIGGDLAMAGDAPHPDGWFVAVEMADPADGILCTLAVNGGGVATSSTRSRRWTHAGRERHHLIDPSTGAPSQTDLAAVTVVARAGWEAEAHATAALLSGSAGVLGHLERHGLSGIATTDEGATLLSADLEDLDVRPRVGVR